MQRVWGFFCFVNIMWLLAIFGITISLGPAVWAVTKPLRKVLELVSTWVREAVVYAVKEFVIPVVLRMHAYGVLEVSSEQ